MYSKPGSGSYTLIATCPEECKSYLATELKSLGIDNYHEIYRGIEFTVDSYEDFLKAHLFLRTPSRILCILSNLGAKNFAALKNEAIKLPWGKWFKRARSFKVDGIPGHRGVGLMKANDISRAIRESIQQHHEKHDLIAPRVNLEEPDLELIAFVQNGRCILSYNSSGKSMHKRGYRLNEHPAPLKETLAATILIAAGYDGSQTLYDPMCGSGTIPTEAAMIALKKAPLIHRKKGDFGFEYFYDFDNQLWKKVLDQARLEKNETLLKPIFGSDIERRYIEDSKENALRARVERYISFSVNDFFRTEAPDDKGILMMNLPYGERLQKAIDFEEFYKKIGDHLKRSYSGWTAFLLVSSDSPFKFIGLKPSRKIALKNGSVDVKLLKFDLYAGKKYQNENSSPSKKRSPDQLVSDD